MSTVISAPTPTAAPDAAPYGAAQLCGHRARRTLQGLAPDQHLDPRRAAAGRYQLPLSDITHQWPHQRLRCKPILQARSTPYSAWTW